MNIDFIGRQRGAIIFSLALILAGLVILVLKGGPTYGVDFTGGILIQATFKKKISPDELSRMRGFLREMGLSGNIQCLGAGEDEVLIKIRPSEADVSSEKIREGVESILQKEFSQFQGVYQSDEIDPVISKEIRRGALLAILFANLGILIYLALRFEIKFAVAALIALIHDVLLTILALVFFKVEFSITIIAALLTLAGYSVNDTIVVFDRIRENIKLFRKESLSGIINISINQILGRTIVTSVTTLLAVLSLYLFGGEVIRPFAFALFLGVIVGTYSSIFIASPVLIYWPRRR